MEANRFLSLFTDQTVRLWSLRNDGTVNTEILHENVIKFFYFNNDRIIIEQNNDRLDEQIQIYAIITNSGEIIVVIRTQWTNFRINITKDFEALRDSVNDITDIHFNRIICITDIHIFQVFVVCSQQVHEFLFNQDKKLLMKKSHWFASPIDSYHSSNGSAIMRTVDGEMYTLPPYSDGYKLLNESIGKIHITSIDKVIWSIGSHPVVLSQNKVYLISYHNFHLMNARYTEIIDIFGAKDVSEYDKDTSISLVHKITSDGKCYRDNVSQSYKYPEAKMLNREVFPGRYIRKICSVKCMMFVIFDDGVVYLCEKSSKPESYIELDGLEGGDIYDICGTSAIFIVNYDGIVRNLVIDKPSQRSLIRSDITIRKIDYFDTNKLTICLPKQIKSARSVITSEQ